MTYRQRIIVTLVALLAAVSVFACDDTEGPDDFDVGSWEVLDTTCPETCDRDPRCARDRVEVCCACVAPPRDGMEVERCGPSQCDEHSGTGPVDVGCFAENIWTEALPESEVRVVGVVDVYATGGSSSDGIHVEIYRMEDDASLGTKVGEFVTSEDDAPCDEARNQQLEPFLVESGEEAESCQGICSEMIPDTGGDCRDLGFYAIDGVPTHVPLIFLTHGAPLWRELYAFNVMFFDEDVINMEIDGVEAPTIYYKARVLSNGDFSAIPLTAGMPGGIPESHGAIAGEVHDCGDVRLRNVKVGIFPYPGSFVYFNGVESKPYPDGNRNIGTNWLGLFAGLDIDPEDNPIHVSAIGTVDGELVSLGWARVRVYPGAVSTVTLRGTRPGLDVYPSDGE